MGPQQDAVIDLDYMIQGQFFLFSIFIFLGFLWLL